MKLSTSYLLSTILLPSSFLHAFLEPEEATVVASKSFVSPVVSFQTGVVNEQVNVDGVNFVVFDQDEQQQLVGDDKIVPFAFASALTSLESTLGARDTIVDYKSGKIQLLTLSTPLFPGGGFENGLLWNVDSTNSIAEVDETESPATISEYTSLAITSIKNWLNDHATTLQIRTSELGSIRTAVHSEGDMIQLSMDRLYNNIPVLGSRIMATIKLGNLVNVGLEGWGDINDLDILPTLSAEDANKILAKELGLTLVVRGPNKCEPELQILTLDTPSTEFGQGYEYTLVWKICPLFENQDVEVMEGLVDAHTGQVYSFVDKVHYLQAKGGVYPISNDKQYPDGIEQPGWPMPYMYVGSEITSTGGNYYTEGTLTASLNGPYVQIADNCGSSTLSSSDGFDWGTSSGTDCTTPGFGGNGNTHSARTNFYELNKVIEMARSHLPNNSWLKKSLRVNLNINNSCNAWWLNTV
jgi:hypothetical protein